MRPRSFFHQGTALCTGALGKSTTHFYREIGINVSVDNATGRRGFELSRLHE